MTSTPFRVGAETERVRTIYDKLAERYDRIISFSERLFFEGGRQWVCSQASGRTLEVAVGTGRNFPFYPHDVTLTGIDVSPRMLEIARRRAEELGQSVDLQLGDAEALGFGDEAFDTVVVTLGFCTIPDDRQAVSEVVRVLRPGGKLLWFEHGYSPTLARVPMLSWIVEHTFDPLLVRFQSDHMLRDAVQNITAHGLLIERFERSKLGIVQRGVARKPE